MLLLLLACVGPDFTGSISVSGPGGRYSSSASDIVLGNAVYEPHGEDAEQLIFSFRMFQLGEQATSWRGPIGSGSATVTVERVRWTDNGRFPFIHEGRIEGDDIEGRFELSESNCHNSVLGDDNVVCQGGYFLGPGEPQVWLDAQTVTDCPAELAERYVDGDRVEASYDALRWGSAKPVKCAPVALDVTNTQGDVAWEGGPYICGASESVRVDGCTWELTVFANPQGSFSLIAATTDPDCGEQRCSLGLTSFTLVLPGEE